MRDDVTIYCIRHGETDWNAEARYQGQADIPLNEKGRHQAQRNGIALRSLLPEIKNADYVASPLSRTRETMRIVRKELGLDPSDFRCDERLREVHFGHWEGQLAADLPQYDPKGLASRKADPYYWRPTDGESYSDLMQRVRNWMDDIERDCVVVAHGGVSRMLRGDLIGADMNGVLQLSVPQDRVLVIKRGEMRWL